MQSLLATPATTRSATACSMRPRPSIRVHTRRTSVKVLATEVGVESKASSEALEKYNSLTVDLAAYPVAKFFRVEAIIRPWRAPAVVKALQDAGIRGLTVSQVQGAGVQGGVKERYGGSEFGLSRLVEKTRIDIVLSRMQVDAVVRIICKTAGTGEIGDGKVFVHPVADVIRVRTGETGAVAERMAGGMDDMKEGRK